MSLLCLMVLWTGGNVWGQQDSTQRNVAAPPVVSGPFLEFEVPNYDFGQVEMGTVVRYTYIYRNIGDADLIILGGKGGCSCVQIEYELDTLAPGEKGEVTLIFDTKNRIGQEKNSLYLITNSSQKIHKARFKGEILWPRKEEKQ